MKHKNRHTLLNTYSFLLLRRALQDSCCVNGVWSHTYLLDCFLQQCWRPANFPDPFASWLCQWEVLAGIWKTRRREKPSKSWASGGTSGHSDGSSCMSVAPQQVQLLAPAQAIGITISGKHFFFYSPSPRGQSCFFQLPFSLDILTAPLLLLPPNASINNVLYWIFLFEMSRVAPPLPNTD